MTTWTEQSPTQTDYDSVETDAFLELSDSDWNVILFHTWIFVDNPTEWTEDTTF